MPGRVTPVSRRPDASPDFENPPVVETSAGFHFAPIQGWTILQYGLLWEKLKDKYPVAEFNPPVNQPPIGMTANFSDVPVRVSFVDSPKSNLVQVQNNFLMHNWRRSDTRTLYQHYMVTRDALFADWKVFRDFLSKQSLKPADVVRCETSYFNHLVRGEDWQEYSELSKLFPAWKGLDATGPLSKPQMISLGAWYARPHGMLQIVAQPALRQSDGKDIIQLTLTATGLPPAQDENALFECLDACHQSALDGFAEFTSEQLQLRWRRVG
jgi:uncharacterized protein (TIGR04255 family)